MNDLTERVGLIAGDGVLPLEFVRSAKKEGFTVVSVGLTENSFSLLKNITENSVFCPIGKPMEIIDYLKTQGVKNIGFAGKVDKKIIFTSIHEFDEHARKILKNANIAIDNLDSFRRFGSARSLYNFKVDNAK